MSHDHPHTPAPAPAPETRDAGSQALAEALRSSFAIVKFALFVLVALIFAAGFFTVGPQERAIILRFGKPQGEGQKMLLGAGLHWSLPYPIDEVIRIPISELQKVTSTAGWYLTTPEMELAGTEPPPGPSLNPAVDGYVITADRNIIHVRAKVTYHVDDPLNAVFNFAGNGTNQAFDLSGISNAVCYAANNAIISTAARFNVDDILTHDFGGFQDAVDQRVRALVEAEKLGVVIDQCTVDRMPPRQLKDVFALVSSAMQNHDKLINDAQSATNRILSEASALAAAITNQAESARNQYVADVRSQADAFEKLLDAPEYKRNPALFEQLKVAEAMSFVLTNVGDKWFIPQNSEGLTPELRLQLNREPPGPKTGGNP